MIILLLIILPNQVSLVMMAVENVPVKLMLLVISVISVLLNILDSQIVKVCSTIFQNIILILLEMYTQNFIFFKNNFLYSQIVCAMQRVQQIILAMIMESVLATLMLKVKNVISVLMDLLNFQVVISVLRNTMDIQIVKVNFHFTFMII